MDWDSKLPPWDMAELEQNHNMQSPNPMSALNTISVGSSVSPFEAMVPSTGLSDCSIDLKLGGSTGRLVNLGVFQKDHHRNNMSASASKRPRAPGNQAQPTTVCCSVDGCESDLSNCRDYHRRHKVCEAHSKTPVVVVGGQEQRFCQQCSRFHMLSEFDEVKRSCRKRLDGHNRRRRKPQSDTVNNPSLFSATHQGSNFSNFPTTFPATLPDHSWIRSATKASQQNLTLHHYLTPQPQQPFSLTFPQGLKEISKRFPFINESTTGETRNGTGSGGIGSISLSVSQPLQNPIPISVSVSSESSGSSGGGGANTNLMHHYSERALSLLSSPPPSATVAAAAAPDLAHDQPLFSNYRYGAVVTTTGLSMEEVHDGSVFMSNSNSSNGIGTAMGHCNGTVSFHSRELYNAGHDEGPSIEDGSPLQPLQFWHQ